MLPHEAEMELTGGSLAFHKVTVICKEVQSFNRHAIGRKIFSKIVYTNILY